MRGALEGPQVSLAQVLESRDQRVQDQAQWLARGGTLVCMTLNMPGPQKRFRPGSGGGGGCQSLRFGLGRAPALGPLAGYRRH